MKIAVCDDETDFLDTVSRMLKKWAQKNHIPLTIRRFTNGDDLIRAQQNESIDLLLLDVVMPRLNGIDTARELRRNHENLPIIFLTSSREFAIDSYDVKAFHYLLKPVCEDRLFSVLDDCRKTIQKTGEAFMAHTATGYCKINIADVDYLEAQNKQVIVYLTNNTSIEIRELFSKCEELFTLQKGFFKCHRSYIVNLNRIEQFTKTVATTASHTPIPISRNNYVAFKEAYFSYMFE